MKIIHTADLHLATPFANLTPSDRDRRNRELIDTFKRLVKYAQENEVRVILLCGDVFDDSETPYLLSSNKKEFYKTIREAPEIRFYYLRGNHDELGNDSAREGLDNLRVFGSDGWTTESFENITIAGIEINDDTTIQTYNDLHLTAKDYNIVLLHGQTVYGTFNNPSKRTGCDIPLSVLKGRNIDYLALGHIHSFKMEQLDERGKWAYSGCLMGRGFDEEGEKGFVLIDTDTKDYKFIEFATSKVLVEEVDITGAKNAHAAADIVLEQLKDIDSPDKHMVKVVLKGDITFDSETELLIKTVEDKIQGFFYRKVEDKTSKKYSVDDFKEDNTLIGEFLKLVREDNALDEKIKEKIQKLGIDILKPN